MSTENGPRLLDDFEQQQDEDDEQDKADASAAVIAKPWAHAIAAKTEHQDQDQQKDDHLAPPLRRRFAR